MIPGDEGKPMNLMEFISDVPRDVEPYLERAIESDRAHRQYWRESLLVAYPLGSRERECVVAAIDHGIFVAEEALRKLRRERREAAAILARVGRLRDEWLAAVNDEVVGRCGLELRDALAVRPGQAQR